ncbi:MAG: magnesium transporter CorA family protein [Clostridiales bacterium]|nr:magnesium transporter CorA family protein [Clostridiales bacterium]
MIDYFKTSDDNSLITIEKAQAGCWISVVEPTEEEIHMLINDFGLDKGFVKSSLDDEENSRVEIEDDQTLIIVDTPFAETQSENTILYYTMPMGIVITESYVFTISVKENSIITDLASGVVRNLKTQQKTRFVLLLLLRITARFLQSLKQIDKISFAMEQQLHGSMKNKELIQLLGLEKSLVYFSTSLKSNDITLEKILRGRVIKLYEEDQDLLEDVIIELKQAIEMANIYSGILSGMMDAFASVISNNLNIVMWRLTIITIIMAIPTMVFSFYGMNTSGLPVAATWFPTLISVAATGAVAFFLLKKKK